MIRPLRDHVLVKPEAIRLSESIIVQNREPFNRGVIVATGPGDRDKKGRLRPVDLVPGQIIRYGNGSYLDWPLIEHGGEKYQMIREADVCFVEEPADVV